MPQLDKFIFVDQAFLVIAFFVGLYVLNVLVLLPKLSIVLKLRQKKLIALKKSILYTELNSYKLVYKATTQKIKHLNSISFFFSCFNKALNHLQDSRRFGYATLCYWGYLFAFPWNGNDKHSWTFYLFW